MNVKMDIYDLVMGASVWSGSLSDYKSVESTYTKERDNALLAIVKVATRTDDSMDQKYPYPEAPKNTDLASAIFRGFAKNFPKPD
jgi:hypothetical protein